MESGWNVWVPPAKALVNLRRVEDFVHSRPTYCYRPGRVWAGVNREPIYPLILYTACSIFNPYI